MVDGAVFKEMSHIMDKTVHVLTYNIFNGRLTRALHGLGIHKLNKSNEEHVFAIRGFCLSEFSQLDPRWQYHRTDRAVSKSDKYLKE